MDVAYLDATVVRVVLDKLNVHVKAYLYVAFAPAEGRRIAPKARVPLRAEARRLAHAAEWELAVLASLCLRGALSDIDTAAVEIAAWERRRNLDRPNVEWHFTINEARRKLKRLYPACR